MKCYLVTRSLDPKGTGQTRWATRWKPAPKRLRNHLRRPDADESQLIMKPPYTINRTDPELKVGVPKGHRSPVQLARRRPGRRLDRHKWADLTKGPQLALPALVGGDAYVASYCLASFSLRWVPAHDAVPQVPLWRPCVRARYLR
jgi:hypothetical protein